MEKEIIKETIKMITKLTDRSDLLSIVCSYGDTLDDAEYLQELKQWNENHAIHEQ